MELNDDILSNFDKKMTSKITLKVRVNFDRRSVIVTWKQSLNHLM